MSDEREIKFPDGVLEEYAPRPWRVDDLTGKGRGYLSIVDATGNRVCDFFPFAGNGGRGAEETLALANLIVEWSNRDVEEGRRRERERCLALAKAYTDRLNIIDAIAMGDVAPAANPQTGTEGE